MRIPMNILFKSQYSQNILNLLIFFFFFDDYEMLFEYEILLYADLISSTDSTFSTHKVN